MNSAAATAVAGRPARNRDARLFAACLVVIFIIALLPLSTSIVWHALLLVLSIGAVVGVKVPASHVLSRAVLIAPGILAAMILLPLIGQGARISVLGISVSEGGIHRGVASSLKLLGIMLWLSLLTWKLPPHRLFPAMAALRFPAWLVEILRSTYRNLAILGREVTTMRQALKSRIVHPGVWLVSAAGNMVSLLFLRTQQRAASQVVARDARCHAGHSQPMVEPPSIQIENVSFRYPGGEADALHGVCLAIPAQSKVAILGCNGAGKTTLLLHLNAVFPLQSGRITISGMELNKDSRALIRQEVGMLFQNPDDQILGLTVNEDVAIGPHQLELSDAEKAEHTDRALRAVGLLKKRDQPPHLLSGGERKRLALAGVLASGARTLLLDEPMAALDPPGRDEITVLLNDLHCDGRTIIAATHDVDFAAEWSTMVVLMDGGYIVAVGPPEILTDTEIMANAGLSLPRVAQPFAEFGAQQVPGTREGALEWLRKRLTAQK